jgi:hypothetical protein
LGFREDVGVSVSWRITRVGFKAYLKPGRRAGLSARGLVPLETQTELGSVGSDVCGLVLVSRGRPPPPWECWGLVTIIWNAKFRVLPPQPASPVSTGQHVNAPQNDAVPRHFADTARSPCRELGYRSAIPPPGLRGRFLVSRFCWTAGPGTGFHYLPRRLYQMLCRPTFVAWAGERCRVPAFVLAVAAHRSVPRQSTQSHSSE